MGRQIQINATTNDIRTLIESVKKEYPTICRLDREGKIIEAYCDQNSYSIGRTFYITTMEVYQIVKKLTDDYDRENPAPKHFYVSHVSQFLNQCVEIFPSIDIGKDNVITGSLDPAGRIYVHTERMEAVDQLYSCFIKQTRRNTIKYKSKNPKEIFRLYSFPEADKIVKDYLSNKGEKNGSVKLIFPDGFVDAFLTDT